MTTIEMLKSFVKTAIREEDGVTAIEYGLIASLIAIGIAVNATSIGTQLTSIFGTIATKLGAA
jgi:pilus assembly protein Flp/PilA